MISVNFSHSSAFFCITHTYNSIFDFLSNTFVLGTLLPVGHHRCTEMQNDAFLERKQTLARVTLQIVIIAELRDICGAHISIQ